MDTTGHYFQPFVRGLFIFAGLVLLIYWYLNYGRINQLKNNGLISKGKIIEIKEFQNYSLDENKKYYPVVEFETQEGLIIREKLEGRDDKQFKIGEDIEVFYNPNNPKDFIVDSRYETEIKYYPILLGCLILFLLGIFG